METRLALASDLEAISVLRSEMKGRPISAESISEQFGKILADDGRAIMVATDDNDTPVGMAILSLVYKLPKTECRIDEVVIAASQQGKGLGTTLMNACEAWAWEQGTDIIELTSRPSRQAANHLYQKLAYEIRETNVYTKTKS